MHMALTQTHRRCRLLSPKYAKPVSTQSPKLVPEATVKDMLREIAYVLHVTRRLKGEIRVQKTAPVKLPR
ncbi:hypothetical protein AYO44_14365 [Planctomycetaceae bacterium SCGC AG-212-F19]|nr:hypothetical protein AYO44_14365 [Planctomycetaceae bacterium SCGC AG-212-F19]